MATTQALPGPTLDPLRREQRAATRTLVRKCVSPGTARLVAELRRYRRGRPPQADALQRLVELCATRVPYYRRALGQLSAGEALRFTDLPIISKATLQDHFAELIAVGPGGPVVGEAPFWISSTSGSTGISSSILKSRGDMLANAAVVQDIFREHSVPSYGHLFDLGLHWTGQPLAQARVVPGAFLCWNFTGYSLDVAHVRQECLDILDLARPTVIYGAPSRVLPFTDLCRTRGVRLRPRLVITTYEHLTEAAAARVSQTFDAPVVQVYGTAETGPLGWTCGLGRWHFDPRTVAIELVDSSGQYVAPGATGRVVVTPLWDRTMPLLRFETGDLGRAPESPCPCGRDGTVIDALEGRASEVVVTTSGQAYSPFSLYRYLSDAGVTDWQLVQRRAGELEVIVPPDVEVPEAALGSVTARVRSYLHEDTTVRLRHGGFLRTGNGKRNAFVRVDADRADEP